MMSATMIKYPLDNELKNRKKVPNYDLAKFEFFWKNVDFTFRLDSYTFFTWLFFQFLAQLCLFTRQGWAFLNP